MVTKLILVVVLLFIQSNFATLLQLRESEDVTTYKGWDTILENNITSVIQLVNSERKSYYFGFHFKASYFQALQFCEDIHMKLINIESMDENNRIYKHIRDANKGDLFWTSGTKLLDGKHWVWMSIGQPVDYTDWAPGNPNNETEHCIAVYHNKTVGLTWVDEDCLIKINFICEKRVEEPNNENEESAPIAENLFQYQFVAPNIALFRFDGKDYYLGRHFKATFQEAIQICNLLQMHLVTINSQNENDRIFKYIRDTNAGETFWTSGSRLIDGTTWVWMSTAQRIDYSKWDSGQPDGDSDNCIQLLAEKDRGMFWTVANCEERHFYVCEKQQMLYFLHNL